MNLVRPGDVITDQIAQVNRVAGSDAKNRRVAVWPAGW
jgi:hypothetical protein